MAQGGDDTAPPARAEGFAVGHSLRGYEGRSVKCPCCKQIGPSPQTGPQECMWCRTCAGCAREQQERGVGHCIVTGMAEDLEECGGDIAWHAGPNVLMVRDAGRQGSFAYAADAEYDQQGNTNRKVEYHVGWTMSYSSGQTRQRAPSVVVGDARGKPIASLPLPEAGEDRRAALVGLTLLLNRLSVSHSLPSMIDFMDQPLPQLLDFPVEPRGTHGTVLTGNAAFLLIRNAKVLHLHQMVPKGAKSVWQRQISWAAPADEEAAAEHPRQCVDMSPDGRRVVVCGRQAQLLSAANGHELCELQSPNHPYAVCLAVCMSSCARYVAVVGGGHQVAVFKAGDGEHIATIPGALLAEYKAGRWCVAFSNSGGALVLSAETDGTPTDTDGATGAVMVLGWRSRADAAVVKPVLHPAHKDTRTVATHFTAGDAGLLVATRNGAVAIYAVTGNGNVAIQRVLQHPLTLRCPDIPLIAAQFHGSTLDDVITATGDGTVWYWTVDGLHTAQRVDENLHKQRGYTSVDFTTTGMIAMTDVDGTVRLNAMPLQCTLPHTAVRRLSQQHAGQATLLIFLMWQTRLRQQVASLPKGVTVLRQLQQDDLKRVASFIPGGFGDVQTGQGGDCYVM